MKPIIMLLNIKNLFKIKVKYIFNNCPANRVHFYIEGQRVIEKLSLKYCIIRLVLLSVSNNNCTV